MLNLTPYRTLFADTELRRIVASSILPRLPVGMNALGLTLLVQSQTGSGKTVAFGLALSVVIYRQKISDRAKIESMQLFGGGLGGITTLVVVPFWLAAAARVGLERRAARESNPD